MCFFCFCFFFLFFHWRNTLHTANSDVLIGFFSMSADGSTVGYLFYITTTCQKIVVGGVLVAPTGRHVGYDEEKNLIDNWFVLLCPPSVVFVCLTVIFIVICWNGNWISDGISPISLSRVVFGVEWLEINGEIIVSVTPKMRLKLVTGTTMMDIACVWNSHGVAVREVIAVIVAMIEVAVKGAAIVVQLRNDHNIGYWFLACHRPDHGKISRIICEKRVMYASRIPTKMALVLSNFCDMKI